MVKSGRGRVNRGVLGVQMLPGVKAFFLYKDKMKDSPTRAHLVKFCDGKFINGSKRIPVVIKGFVDRRGSATGNGNGIDRYFQFHAVGSEQVYWALATEDFFHFPNPSDPVVQQLMQM